jgi:putative addiction module component (TIGR02574 family)
MDSTLLEQARSLSVDEQLALIEALWDGLAQRGETPLPTPAQLAELQRRVAEHEANPDDVVPWDQVQAEVRSRLNR